MDKDFDVNFEEEFDESYSDDEEMRQHQIKAREWQKNRPIKGEPIVDFVAMRKYIKENNIPPEEYEKGLWKKFVIGYEE